MSRQHRIPLLEALQALTGQSQTLFCTPGHKQGKGALNDIASLLGHSVFHADLPDLPGLNLFDNAGVLAESQCLAAEAFGADCTWFLVNGSSSGVMAAILATCSTGEKIILPRTAHQSAIAGLILSGAHPIFINPEYDAVLDVVGCPTPETVAQALKAHPDTKAVLIVSPTYQGICADVAAIAAISYAHNIPLIVDEAHGAHFGFHPALPQSALAAGADIVIQSTHKVLSALTQASMLHLKSKFVEAEHLQKILQILQSTSPSNLLLASLDAARQQMATQGHALLNKTLALAEEGRSQLQISLPVLNTSHIGRPGFYDLDPTRLTVQVSSLGVDGFTADEFLQSQAVMCELPTFQSLTFILTIGTTASDVEHLIGAFQKLIQDTSNRNNAHACPIPIEQSLLQHEMCLTPRDAFFKASETVQLEQAVGHINTEIICSYPPGIPILLPGEKVTRPAIEFLKTVLNTGGFITGGVDGTYQTLKVVKLSFTIIGYS
jgi:arginine decarboxylase